MRIAVVNVTGGRLSGGYAKYLRHLLPLLAADPRVSRLDVFVPPGTDRRLAVPSVPLSTWPDSDARWGFPELKRRLHRVNPDVVFVPTARSISCGRVPVVTMVRNMEPLEIPFGDNPLAVGLKNVARALVARWACRRATRVIAVSGHVRDFLTDRWGLDPAKIGVVHHGVERPAECGEPRRPPSVPSAAAGPFVFTAGSIRPARGLEDAIDALGLLRDTHPLLTLVIAGEPDPDVRSHRERLTRRARERAVADRIVWAGSLTPPEMWWCFDACAAFVMTSRAEACPNTVLEAMSRRCLSVSVNRQPMPEMFGDTALYYAAGDAEDLAARLAVALTGTEESSAGRRAAGEVRAAEFSWERTAERTVTELREAVSGSGTPD